MGELANDETKTKTFINETTDRLYARMDKGGEEGKEILKKVLRKWVQAIQTVFGIGVAEEEREGIDKLSDLLFRADDAMRQMARSDGAYMIADAVIQGKAYNLSDQSDGVRSEHATVTRELAGKLELLLNMSSEPESEV